MFTDADLSAPIDEILQLLTAISKGADVAIGSRWIDRKTQTVPQPLYRSLLGRAFNLVTRTLLGLPFADTQCGFKAFRRDAAHKIFGLQRIEGWGFDAELLFIARKLGYLIDEVSVTWAHDNRSKLRYFRSGLAMLRDAAVIRYTSLCGGYEARTQSNFMVASE
jgi:hypothetical protein